MDKTVAKVTIAREGRSRGVNPNGPRGTQPFISKKNAIKKPYVQMEKRKTK